MVRLHDVMDDSQTEQPSLRWSRGELLLGMLIAALVIWLFADTALLLVQRWASDPNYNHGFLIPLVSLVFYFRPLQVAARKRTFRGNLAGVTLLGIGLCLQIATTVVASLVAESLALLFVLGGLALLLATPAQWERLKFPLIFLVFMIPWPAFLYQKIAFPLQMLVSQLASLSLQIAGVTVLRSGNLLHLPGQTMHVAESCSGIRQLTAFVALGVCAAMLVERPTWYRMLVLFATVPIAIVVNLFRVVLMGLLINAGKVDWTTGWLHDFEGLAMVLLGLALFRGYVAVLDWVIIAPSAAVSMPVAAASRTPAWRS